jgi:hypothetical protein
LVAVLCLGAWLGGPSIAAADSSEPSLDDSTLVALAVALGSAPAPDLGDLGAATITPSSSVLQLVARIHASALVFSDVPRVRVAFGGGQRTVWSSERVNLPVHVTPGVVYRDVLVRLTVSGTPEDLMSLLADARQAARGLRLERDAAVAAAPVAVPPTAAAPVSAPAPVFMPPTAAATPVTAPAYVPPTAVAAPVTAPAYVPLTAVAAPVAAPAYAPPTAVAAPVAAPAYVPPTAVAGPVTAPAYVPPTAVAAPVTAPAYVPPTAVAAPPPALYPAVVPAPPPPPPPAAAAPVAASALAEGPAAAVAPMAAELVTPVASPAGAAPEAGPAPAPAVALPPPPSPPPPAEAAGTPATSG